MRIASVAIDAPCAEQPLAPAVAEAARLARLRQLVVLDTPAEAVFDRIARMASDACATPIALVSLVDGERQWFKANIGLAGVTQTPREQAFCAHAIAADTLLEVADATVDARFSDNPLVVGAPNIRFYAGAPLVMPDGARVGTLCVIDRAPRRLDAAQARTLSSLAAIASEALLMRQRLIEKSLAVRSEHERELPASEARLRALVEEQAEFVSLADADGRLLYLNPAYGRYFGRAPAAMIGQSLFDFVEADDADAVRAVIARVLATGQEQRGENRMRSVDGSECWVAWTNRLQRGADGEPMLHSVGRDVTERKRVEAALAASERFVRQLTDMLPVRMAYVDKDMRFRFVNVAHCARFARPREEIIGRSRDELTGEPMSAEVAQRVAAALAGEPQRFEFEERSAAGLRRIESQLIPDVAEDGSVRGFYSTGIDVTERAAAENALRMLTAIFDNTTDFVVQADRTGRVVYMNPAVRQAIGLAADAPVAAHHFGEFNTEATNQQFADVIVPAVRAGGVWLGKTTVYVAGRRELPVSHMVLGHRDGQGRIERYSSVMRDISAEVRAERQLQRQTATLRAVVEALPAIVEVVDADQRYRLVNSAYERWFGATRESVIGATLAAVHGPADYARSRPWVERVLAGETVDFEKDHATSRGTRHLRVSYIPLWVEGRVDGFIGIAHDVTQHKREQVRLLQLAQRDALTGLLNRAGIEEFLVHQTRAGNGESLAMLYIDLDHFKPVNDRHGHPAGDEVLRQFAARVSQLVRPSDAVGRLGGDEFAVVLPGVRSLANARVVADKIVAAAARPFDVGGLSLHIGASVGVAFGIDASGGWKDLVARADAMLYKAKRAGRGRAGALTAPGGLTEPGALSDSA